MKKWWIDKNWSIPTPDALSTTGIMIYYDDKPLCSAWLYQTDSSMAVIGFMIADERRGKIKSEGIKLLLLKLEEVGKNLGFRSIFFPTSSNGVARLGAKLNYSSTPTNELAKII